ncbi:MAG TPA: STAS domain-containing protein [Anaerolineae bacterium]|jgi:anti-sigma B factor antagonist|nr:STAS domain-containing protein [Anaerolineae bacterium]
MNIETRQLKHVTVVTVVGRVDSATAPELEKKLHDLIEGNASQLILDLKQTEYMSSAGLRVLVSSLKLAKKNNGDLRLAQISTRVQEVLDLAGLTPVFHIHPDLVEAVGSF